MNISSATAWLAPGLLKALAILWDTTVRRSAVDQEDLDPYWSSVQLGGISIFCLLGYFHSKNQTIFFCVCGFRRPDLSPRGYRNRCFLVALCCLIIRRQLRIRDQEAFPSAGKKTRIVLVPCSHMDVFPYSYFQWCWYFWGPWVSFVMSSQWESQKIISKVGVSWTHSLPFYF